MSLTEAEDGDEFLSCVHSSLSLLPRDCTSTAGGTGLKVSPDRILEGLGVEEEKLGSLREEPGREVTEEGKEEPGREDMVEHTGRTLAEVETASEGTRALPDERVEDDSYIHINTHTIHAHTHN